MIGNLGLGGAQSVLYHLWPSLHAARGYEFDICVLNAVGHFGEKLRSEGARIHCLESKRKYDPTAVLALRRIIRRGNYNIVHAHLFPELHLVRLAAAGIKNIRLVYTEHLATNRRRQLGVAGKIFDRLAYDSYGQVIAVNASTKQNLVEWQPGLADRSTIIKNGVRKNHINAAKSDLLEELGLSPNSDKTLILFAGRLNIQKGVDVLLAALSEMGRDDYICLIAGDGEERHRLEAMAATLGLQDRVRFMGNRSDVTGLLKQADFMALPSRYEGLPIIILEAMAAGCPIIATAVDGTAEVLRDDSALLVPADDSRSLAGAIKKFLDNPSLRDELANRASIEAEEYSAERNAERLFAVYDKVLARAVF